MILPWLLSAATLQAPLVFRSDVEAVRVDTLVVRDGRPARGLVTGDFEVRENGVRQEIAAVQKDADAALDVLFLFDTSTSAGGAIHKALIDAAKAVFSGLKERDRASLLTFSHEVRREVPLTKDLDSVLSALRLVDPAGSTSLRDALFAAALCFEQGDARRLILLFTDGDDTASFLEDYQVQEALARANVLLYAFSTGSSRETDPRKFLQTTAKLTGGRMISPKNPFELTASFREALLEVRARYILRYTPLDGAPGWKRIEVRVRGGGKVTARRGYLR